MSRNLDEQLDQAFSTLDIFTVARHFGYELKPGVQKTPFREDKNGKSFSISRFKGTGPHSRWKDFVTDDGGGVWQFVEMADPSLSGKQIRDLLVTLSGQEPKNLTPGKVKAEQKIKREKLYADQDAALERVPDLPGEEPPEWSALIRDRWADGVHTLAEQAAATAASRGWDERVMLDLLEQGKTSAPALPWNRGTAWAWLVEKPILRKGSGGRALDLVPVGYHGRYKFREPAGIKKNWHYVPSIPETKKPDGSPKNLTDFQRHLVEFKTKLPAYPFVLGDLENPRLVVILEGQFDAVSFAEAFGWLKHGFPVGVSVFGLRGVHSRAPFLAAYGHWLKRNGPAVWVIGDGDKAGRELASHTGGTAINREPSFIEKIRGLGVSELRGELVTHQGAKDFNDVYKAARPTLEEMHHWAALRGFNRFVTEQRKSK